MTWARSSLAAALLLCWLPVTTQASERSTSYSLWAVTGNTVLMRYTLPQDQLRHLVPQGWPTPATAQVSAYLLRNITVQSAGGECPALDQGYDIGKVDPLAAGPGLYSFELMFHCSDPHGMTLSNTALHDRVLHTDFARVQVNGGDFVPVVFSRGHERLTLVDAAPATPSGAARYLRLGAAHVLDDLAGACFVLCLAPVLVRRRQAAWIAAGLALGYLCASLLAATNLAALRLQAGEACTGLLVACIALLWVVPQPRTANRMPLIVGGGLLVLAAVAALAQRGEAALLLAGAALFAAGFLRLGAQFAARPALWLLPTWLFGLVDGFVLPADWDALGLSRLMPATAILAFNTGVLLGNLVLCAAAATAISWLSRGRLRAWAPWATDLSAATLVGVGTFWLISRGFA